jgi:hypothetical protein
MAEKLGGKALSSRRKLLHWLGLGLGLALFSVQLWQVVQAFGRQALSLSHPAYWLAAAAATVLAYGLVMAAWLLIMRGQGFTLTYAAVLKGYTLSFLPRYIPGSVWGYWSRSEWLKSRYDIPYARSALGSVVEVGLIVLTGSQIVASHYMWGTGQAALDLVAAGSFCLAPVLAWYAFNLIWARLIHRQPQATWRNDGPVIARRHWLGAYFSYLAMWVCYGLSLRLLEGVFVTGFEGGLLGATFVFSLSWLAGFVVVFVPAGLGVRELALSSLLSSQSVALAGAAGALAVGSRGLMYLAELLWLCVGLLMTNLQKSTAETQRTQRFL